MPDPDEHPLDSEPEARNSNILKSLWFPISTIPTRKSGQIVYGCASLLGERWDFSLVVCWNWQYGVGVCILSIEESWWYEGPCWSGQPGERCGPRSWHLQLLKVNLFSSTLTPVVLLMIILSLILVQWSSQGFSGDSKYTPVAVLLLLLIIGVTVIIWRQPQNPIPLYFKVSGLMCPNCPPGVNMLHGLNIQGVRGTAKTNRLFPDPPQYFTYTVWVGTEYTVWRLVFLPTLGRDSHSGIWGVFRDELTLPHRSLLCLSSHWWASLWTFTWWCR